MIFSVSHFLNSIPRLIYYLLYFIITNNNKSNIFFYHYIYLNYDIHNNIRAESRIKFVLLGFLASEIDEENSKISNHYLSS